MSAPPWRRLASWLILTALSLAAFLAHDLARRPATSPPEAPAPPLGGAARPRAFVLVVDSLRYDVAADERRMPHLAALRRRGVWAQVEPPPENVTLPSVRAALTGQEQSGLLGVLDNFRRGPGAVPSLLSQARGRGLTVAAWSDVAFNNFAGDLSARFLVDGRPGAALGEELRQRASLEQALLAHLDGRYDLVFVHVTWADHVAHQAGIRRPAYAAAFRAVDDAVGTLDAAIPAEGSLMVMGDHGHDERGVHALGMDLPSALAVRGPGFRAGVDLGRLRLTVVRYLLGWALQVPLSTSYRGPVRPEALQASGPPGGGYDRAEAPAEAPRGFRATVLAGSLLTLCAAGCWMWIARGAATPRKLLAAAGAALVAALLWGFALACLRPRIHDHPQDVQRLLGLALAALGPLAARRWGAARGGWAVLAAVGLLGYPSVYEYGSPALAFWAWLGWAGALLAGAPGSRRRAVALWLWGAFLFLQLCALAVSENFRLVSWTPLVPGLAPGTPAAGLAAALAALAVAVVRPGHGPLPIAVGVFTTGVLALGPLGLLSVMGPRGLALTLGAAALALASRRLGQGEASAAVRHALLVLALLFAYQYLVRVDLAALVWLLWSLAGLVLSAEALRHCEDEAVRTQGHVVLLLLGVVAAGWAALRWNLAGLEWAVLHEYLAPLTVEDHAGLLAPLIALRYAVPVVLVRVVLAERLGPLSAAGHRLAWLALAAKLLTTVAVTLGLAAVLPGSAIVIDAASQCAVLLVLMLGLVP